MQPMHAWGFLTQPSATLDVLPTPSAPLHTGLQIGWLRKLLCHPACLYSPCCTFLKYKRTAGTTPCEESFEPPAKHLRRKALALKHAGATTKSRGKVDNTEPTRETPPCASCPLRQERCKL